MKLKKLLHRIPRPVKACVCAILAIVLILCYYVMLGCPTLTMKQEFRRAEKAHLVGPSEIVDVVEYEQYSEFDKLYVGATANGVSFFGRYYSQFPYDNPLEEKLYYFTYIEKTDDMTLCVAPNVRGGMWDFVGGLHSLPVYLFTEDQNAVRAELVITVTGSVSSNGVGRFEVPFRASADRSEEGFFRFDLNADRDATLTALYYLSSALGGDVIFDVHIDKNLTGISAVIRLYDADGQLIQEDSRALYPVQ